MTYLGTENGIRLHFTTFNGNICCCHYLEILIRNIWRYQCPNWQLTGMVQCFQIKRNRKTNKKKPKKHKDLMPFVAPKKVRRVFSKSSSRVAIGLDLKKIHFTTYLQMSAWKLWNNISRCPPKRSCRLIVYVIARHCSTAPPTLLASNNFSTCVGLEDFGLKIEPFNSQNCWCVSSKHNGMHYALNAWWNTG